MLAPLPALEAALALHQTWALAQAALAYEALLVNAPDDARVLNLLGSLRLQQRRVTDALTLLARAVQLAPGEPEHHGNLSAALLAQGELAAAEGHARVALALRHDYVDARYNLGLALGAQGRLREGLAELDRAALATPDSARLHSDRGALLLPLGEHAAALAAFYAALHCDPACGPAHSNLAQWFRSRHDLDRSQLHARRALELEPDSLEAAVHALECDRLVCDWTRPLDPHALAARAAAHPAPTSSFAFVALPLSPAEQLAVARVEGARLASAATARGAWREGLAVTPPGERLRVGYLTSDVRNHPTSHLLRRVFALHDRARVEVFLYSTGPDDGSSYRRDISASVEHFCEARGADDVALARRVAGDGIDVLVDVQGYTAMQRLGVLALRPAPVQCHYLAYPATLGADFVDYYLGDRAALPPALTAHFHEQIAWLPGCYQANDDEQPVSPEPFTRERCGLPARGVVYCCFNAGFKLEPEVWALWMRLLREVPEGVLWLLAGSHGLVRNLQREARSAGVDPARLVFATRLSKELHLARLRCADVALDTLYYGAHTTGSDALWAGVPLVSTPGENFASRVGASMLRAQGLEGLIAPDRESYVALAASLGLDEGKRAHWRERTERARREGTLFDSARSTRALERAYAHMARRARAGLAPESFEVET